MEIRNLLLRIRSSLAGSATVSEEFQDAVKHGSRVVAKRELKDAQQVIRLEGLLGNLQRRRFGLRNQMEV